MDKSFKSFSTSGAEAVAFVEGLELPEVELLEAPGLENVAPPFDFNEARNQALVVGSDIVSFVRGVTDERRQDLVNSALLAQLAANKAVPGAANITKWYDAYFEVLSNIGWVVQERQFAEHTESGANFEAHQAIMSVATALLGPSPAALAVIKTTLDALKSMGEGSPWIRIFNRESQTAKTARFQVTLAEPGENEQFRVTLMSFALIAKSNLTQVLFVKLRSNEVKLQHASGAVTINTTVLAGVREAIANRIVDHASAFIRGLPDM